MVNVELPTCSFSISLLQLELQLALQVLKLMLVLQTLLLAAALYILTTQSGEQMLALQHEAESGAKVACGESSIHLSSKVR
jgi:hypothetical protein